MTPTPKLPTSIRAYLASIGRKGGSRTSEAKRAAALKGSQAASAARGSTVTALCAKHGLSRGLLSWRLRKGMTLAEALEKPVRAKAKSNFANK